jgi:hypothetical protein
MEWVTNAGLGDGEDDFKVVFMTRLEVKYSIV